MIRCLTAPRIALFATVLLIASFWVLALSQPTGAAPFASAASYYNHCPSSNVDPKNDRGLPIGSVQAHAMSCAAARQAIDRGTITIHCCGEPGPAYTKFRTPGFSCKGTDPVVCTNTSQRRRFRFAYGE